MIIKNEQGNNMFSFCGGQLFRNDKYGEHVQTCIILSNNLNWGNYAIDFMAFAHNPGLVNLCTEDDIISFTIASKEKSVGAWMGKEPGDITPHFDFTEERL